MGIAALLACVLTARQAATQFANAVAVFHMDKG
jgi:hypothetical protein